MSTRTRTGPTRLALVVLLATVTIAAAPSAAQKPFQLEDIFELETVSSPEISPDGKRVVYVRYFYDIQTDMEYSNLWIVGTRRIHVEGDERCLYLSGIVRPIDVRPDNTIPSTMVGDLRIRSSGKGAETKFTRQGWFSKGANKLWPF